MKSATAIKDAVLWQEAMAMRDRAESYARNNLRLPLTYYDMTILMERF
jgi:hypothetical protein